ncbi:MULTISPECIES: LacI family DNA-binding transcriptional regulator [Labrys]|uniref:LacI family DNA-binding transcriptional regulator n=1 Tax=Labrys neptuniae TaxID=376174 RepID=A0ABV3PKY6_9HYPH
MATIRDVSRRAGVSRSTVSRIIAGNGYVSDNARQAVEAAIAELGYRPNTMARGLRSNRSEIIGAVVVNVASPFYAQMVGGMQSVCRAADKSILLASGYAQAHEEARAILELIDRSCDGLILYLENAVSDEVKEVVAKADIPIVAIGGEPTSLAWARVGIDNYNGALDGMRYLLTMGHRDIAYFAGTLTYFDTRERLRGIDTALAEAGMSRADIHLEAGDYKERFGYEATERLLASGRQVSAIFAGDDDIGAGVLLALRHHGVRAPEQISLLGFDDNFHARHLTPSLTTIRQPTDIAGQTAARLLLDMIADRNFTPEDIVIPAELIVRESVIPHSAGQRTDHAAEATRA